MGGGLEVAMPHRMARHIRLYLVMAALRCFAVATVLEVLPADKGNVYGPTVDLLNDTAWAVLWAVIGVVVLVAAVRHSERLSRLGLVLVATVSSIWAAAVSVTAWDKETLVWLTAIAWWALVAKDLSTASQPVKAPFDTLDRVYPEDGE